MLSHVNLADATRTVVLMTAEMAKRTSLDELKCRVGLRLGGALIRAVWLTFQVSFPAGKSR